MLKYDQNRNGSLDETEWSKMQGNPRLVDANADNIITTRELIARVLSYGNSRRRSSNQDSTGELDKLQATPEAVGTVATRATTIQDSDDDTADPNAELNRRRRLKFYVPRARIPTGIPLWFLGRDQDGDAQLTLSEFAPSASRSALAEFERHDLNRDGILTAKEFLRASQGTDKAKRVTRK